MVYAFSFFLVLFSSSTFAQMQHAPPSFKTSFGNNAVFVDFKTVNYQIEYDVPAKKAYAKTKISFESSEAGFPIFDLVSEPISIQIDGAPSEQALIATPYGESSIRIVKSITTPGVHTLEITTQIKEGVSFASDSVSSAFWTSDLDDRNYMEQYLPSNYEYDQFQITIEMTSNGKEIQDIATNGTVHSFGVNHYEIRYPGYFTTSSVFFHTFPMGKFSEKKFDYKSINGMTIPVRIYAKYGFFLNMAETKTINTLTELEKDYGPFPHPSVTIYLAGAGGMEYCGATMSDLSALDHELTHSYFARGMLPSNGNAGWMDEAIASWRDDGYKNLSEEKLYVTQMASHPVYTRKTDTDAYDSGARFMAYLNHLSFDQGGLKKFLKQIIDTRLFKPLTTEDFHSDYEKFFGIDVAREYSKYVYGKDQLELPAKTLIENPKHQKMSVKEMQSYL